MVNPAVVGSVASSTVNNIGSVTAIPVAPPVPLNETSIGCIGKKFLPLAIQSTDEIVPAALTLADSSAKIPSGPAGDVSKCKTGDNNCPTDNDLGWYKDLDNSKKVTAKPTIDNQTGETVVSFTFDRVGAKKFGKATGTGVGKRLAIILDGKIISAPQVREPIIGGSGQISGNFTFQSATDLSLLLRSGALPTPLIIAEESTVGPDLGKDSIKAGIISLIIGFILVILFMIYKYRIFGLVANIALIINLIASSVFFKFGANPPSSPIEV